MNVTVCELTNDPHALEPEWLALVRHVRKKRSDLVLLPEMPFYPWIALTRQADRAVWKASVLMHERWLSRLPDLSPAAVLGSRPVTIKGKRLNEGFIWSSDTGYMAVHHKHYLPDDDGWWEASWYARGKKDFTVVQQKQARIGFLICTELWFSQHARDYAKQDIDLLVCPRATGSDSVNKWIVGGQAAAVVSGAFCLSSNFAFRGTQTMP